MVSAPLKFHIYCKCDLYMNVPVPYRFNILTMIYFQFQGGNYREYFAKKMAELKARGRPTLPTAEERQDNSAR